ncbi:MAG: hypothetical protein LBG19_11735 [Prevotellaceae bacterium]|jgi:hypothetical protein|nr:hypothetical protein [Prevotellaceae bacterium]
MDREEYIKAFVQLGSFIEAWLRGDESTCNLLAGNNAYGGFNTTIQLAVEENEWFTESGIRKSLAAIASEMLNGDKLVSWVQNYPYCDLSTTLKPIGVIAAGNIPLVCFHDIICVLISGYAVLLKLSSKDKVLVEKIAELLAVFEPKLDDRIKLVDTIKKSDISGLIATGSNNTSRYIDYEYSDIPVINRKNRTGIAILTGNETEKELELLSDDVFSYFGMGCRNVSKLYVPCGYDFTMFIGASTKWKEGLGRQSKYIYSYRHEYAISQSLNEQYINGGFFLLKENKTYNSPLSVIYYEFFSNLDSVKNQLIQSAEQLQCVVSADGEIGNVRFGQTQKPSLFDYADGIDTMQWLNNNIK